MGRITRFARLIQLAAVAMALVPAAAFADQAKSGTETVTVQVDFTMPTGTAVIGTLVAKRNLGDSTQTDVSFNGMINGQPATATGTGVERWTGDALAEIEVTSIDTWNASVGKPESLTISMSQTGPGLVSINGLPVAMNAPMRAPGSGDLSYTMTNAGTGPQEIVFLPRTGDGSLLVQPLVIVALLVTPGMLMILLSTMLRKAGKKSSRVSIDGR